MFTYVLTYVYLFTACCTQRVVQQVNGNSKLMELSMHMALACLWRPTSTKRQITGERRGGAV